MAIAYFCRRASSWMSFDRILNTTLPNTLLEFKGGGHRRTFPPLVTQGNFGLTVPLLINTNHRNKKIKSLTDLAFPFPWVTPGTKFVWLYHWYLYCLCRLWTQVSIKINNNLMIWPTTVEFLNHNFPTWGNCLAKYAHPEECTFKTFVTSFKSALFKNLRLTDISGPAWIRAVCLLHSEILVHIICVNSFR